MPSSGELAVSECKDGDRTAPGFNTLSEVLDRRGPELFDFSDSVVNGVKLSKLCADRNSRSFDLSLNH